MDKVKKDIQRAFKAAKDTAKKYSTPNPRFPPFGDYDNDNVVNLLDCNPLNPEEQGILHDYMEKRQQKLIEKYQRELDKKREEQQRAKQILEEVRSKTRGLGGTEGKIYLLIKTTPLTWTMYPEPFNSRIEASMFAEQYFPGKKYRTISEQELKLKKELEKQLAEKRKQTKEKLKRWAKSLLESAAKESDKQLKQLKEIPEHATQLRGQPTRKQSIQSRRYNTRPPFEPGIPKPFSFQPISIQDGFQPYRPQIISKRKRNRR